MTDIVERLRARADDKFIRDAPLMREAADEIERLRAGAERDAKTIGGLQYVMHELLLCEIDNDAEVMIRKELGQ